MVYQVEEREWREGGGLGSSYSFGGGGDIKLGMRMGGL